MLESSTSESNNQNQSENQDSINSNNDDLLSSLLEPEKDSEQDDTAEKPDNPEKPSKPRSIAEAAEKLGLQVEDLYDLEFKLPGDDNTLLRRNAAITSLVEMLCACISSGFSQMRAA